MSDATPIAMASIIARPRSLTEIGLRSERSIRLIFSNQLVAQFRANAKLLSALAREYGFRLSVFLQPAGLFDPTNPFVPDAARKALGYAYLEEMFAALREEAAKGLMIDISMAYDGMTAARYIDVAHYSPEANRILAAEIWRRLVGVDAARAAPH